MVTWLLILVFKSCPCGMAIKEDVVFIVLEICSYLFEFCLDLLYLKFVYFNVFVQGYVRLIQGSQLFDCFNIIQRCTVLDQ